MLDSSEFTKEIVFGFDRKTDERSLASFISLFSNSRLLDVLIPRMTDQEILQLVDQLSTLMRRHLSEREYHRLFLGERGADKSSLESE